MRKVGGNCEVSVIVPAYNEESCIEACLNSLLSQTHPSYEIIVVDDGSTDRTIDIVKDFQVTLLRQAHQGPARARNLGASVAAGRILVFCDADMEYARDFLERLVAPIKAEMTIGTSTKQEFVANMDNLWARCWNLNMGGKGGWRIPQDRPDESPVFRAILKSEFKKVGGFDDRGYADDKSLSAKLGILALNAPGARCYHHNPSSLKDIFVSARWIGKGEKPSRNISVILRHLPILSIPRAIIKAVQFRTAPYFLFKMTYDLGI